MELGEGEDSERSSGPRRKHVAEDKRARHFDTDRIPSFFTRTNAEHEYFLSTAKKAFILGSDGPDQRNREIHHRMNRLWINKDKKYEMVRMETIHLVALML